MGNNSEQGILYGPYQILFNNSGIHTSHKDRKIGEEALSMRDRLPKGDEILSPVVIQRTRRADVFNFIED